MWVGGAFFFLPRFQGVTWEKRRHMGKSSWLLSDVTEGVEPGDSLPFPGPSLTHPWPLRARVLEGVCNHTSAW